MAGQNFDASRWLKQYQAEWQALTPDEQRKRLKSALTYSGLLALGPAGQVAAQAYFVHEHGPQLRAVERALRQSLPRTTAYLRKQLSEFDAADLAELWPMLADTAMEAAAYIGGGGIVGAVLFGAPTGGAAAPVGAALGVKAGAWVYKAVGIAELALDMPDMFEAVTKPYRKGFSAAWTLGELGSSGGADQHVMLDAVAIDSFAEGHTLLTVALLSTLAILLLQKGARNSPLFEALRRGKLGQNFASWAERNQVKLMESRRLKPQKSLGERVQEANARQGERRPPPDREEKKDKPPVIPRTKVPCFPADGLPSPKVPEFDRQLAGQQAGLNKMTVDEYLQGRATFTSGASKRNPKIAKAAREQLRDDMQSKRFKELVKHGVSPTLAKGQAATEAASKMRTLAALHNPDMISGGADKISDFGDRQVNSKIGAQWRSRVATLDAAAQRIAAHQRNARMNASLERCK